MKSYFTWGFADIADCGRLGSNELRVGARLTIPTRRNKADDPVRTAAERNVDIKTS
jgi:hypothetical protein